jgi:hypothetical protein
MKWKEEKEKKMWEFHANWKLWWDTTMSLTMMMRMMRAGWNTFNFFLWKKNCRNDFISLCEKERKKSVRIGISWCFSIFLPLWPCAFAWNGKMKKDERAEKESFHKTSLKLSDWNWKTLLIYKILEEKL